MVTIIACTMLIPMALYMRMEIKRYMMNRRWSKVVDEWNGGVK